MQTYFGTENFPILDFAIVTAGTFDGVHLGHQKILTRLQENCLKHQGESVVITYHPHPRIVLNKDYDLRLLSTLDEKIRDLEIFGVQHLLVIPFTAQFSELSSEEFIQQILVEKVNTRQLLIGYDHRFGKNRQGSFNFLKDYTQTYGFEVEEIPAQQIDENAISSTKIRTALLKGEVQTAKEYLGRAYSLTGKVVKGNQLGRTLGYPTANLEIADVHKLIPADGVYVVQVTFDNRSYGGLLSIGSNPTVNGQFRTVEAYLLDFQEDIYDKTLTVHLLHLLRGQQKFAGLPELVTQMKKDEVQARKMLFSRK
ncbi:MAG: bifunctional riboflavin kinase/FAD synthetase [Verrucomicrobia bacterium]|nr:bifunctional riboflavin kinase/FAD synthetase [Cytophagales bacterium]